VSLQQRLRERAGLRLHTITIPHGKPIHVAGNTGPVVVHFTADLAADERTTGSGLSLLAQERPTKGRQEDIRGAYAKVPVLALGLDAGRTCNHAVTTGSLGPVQTILSA
jgi:hypothetical protein